MKKTLVLAFAMMLGLVMVSQNEAHAYWSKTGYFSLRVLGHKFTKVKVTNYGCTLEFKVSFNAPRYKYMRGQYYRFQAKVTLKNGAWIRTGIFGNRGAGNRTYTYRHNTSRKGCWARRNRSGVRYLNVRVCRGNGCTPPPFR